jgi:hypothetical protein
MSLWQRLTYPFRSGPRRPLATRQPQAAEPAALVPLGMEATDLSAVSAVNRRNDSLERSFGGIRPGTRAQDRAAHVERMPDDETYAARFHRAFQQKGS